MTTLREKQLEDEIKILRAQLGNPPEEGQEVVDAIFNNIYLGERPDQRGILIPMIMPKSPGLEVGKTYRIGKGELAHPWWKRV